VVLPYSLDALRIATCRPSTLAGLSPNSTSGGQAVDPTTTNVCRDWCSSTRPCLSTQAGPAIPTPVDAADLNTVTERREVTQSARRRDSVVDRLCVAVEE
jgi:hypothetical protein